MKILLLPAFVCMAIAMPAQQSGTVKYKETVQMQIQLDSATRAMMGNSFPSEHSSEKILMYNENQAIYQNAPKPPAETSTAGDENGPQIVIKMDEPDNRVYTDRKNNTRTDRNDFMGRKFLIDGQAVNSSWKTTGNSKTVAGYSCQEATQVIDDLNSGGKDTVTAWFTSAIPVSLGPSTFGGLPGLILEAKFGHGHRLITATDVDLKSPDSKQIKKPKDGKKVTREEYNKIVAEKMKEMNEQFGGKGNVIIKIDHD